MAPYYDLFVLLDPETPEERRTALVEQVKGQIGSRGATLKGDADWGMRRLSYEIDHRREAQYHLFQFEGTPEALRELDRSLSIEDSVLRHRIIRLPGEPPETTPRPAEEQRRTSDERPPREGARAEAADAPAPTPAAEEPAAEQQAPAEPAPVATGGAPTEPAGGESA